MSTRSEPSAYAGTVVAVLGASGFIGRWVARALTAAGADVHLIVRDAGPVPRLCSEYAIGGAVHEADLADPRMTRSLLHRLSPSVVFNLAGYGVDPNEKREVSERVAGELNEKLPALVAETLGAIPAGSWTGRRIVHTGSVFEYGNVGGHLKETGPTAPYELYGRSKLAGTQRLAKACQAGGISGLTARICQIYGPGEHPGRLLPLLFASRHRRDPLSLSVGTQLKDFTYVEDVADGLLRLGLTRGQPGEVVNLATGRLTTVRHFVLLAAHVLQIGEDRLKFEKPLPDNELQHREVAIVRLQSLTGWSPSVEVADGIRRTLHFLDRADNG